MKDNSMLSLVEKRYFKAKDMYYKYHVLQEKAFRLKQKWLKKYNYYDGQIKKKNRQPTRPAQSKQKDVIHET
jgi:hypothetical protein